MSGYRRQGSDLFDSISGAWVGKIDANGGEQVYPTALALPVYPMRKVRKGLASVRSNISNMTIACAGDSETAGNYANGSTVWVANKPRCYPTLMATILQNLGVNTNVDSVISDNSSIGHTSTVQAFDPKMVVGANWGVATGANTAGGQWIQNIAGTLSGTAADEKMTFTPAAAFDTVEIYWYRSGSVGTMTIDTGGAALTTLSTTGSTAGTTTPGTTGFVNKTVLTGTSGSVINIIRTVVGSTIIAGINTYLSTKKTVNVLNMGWSGARCSTTYWTGTTGNYNPLATLSAYAPDLTIIMLGVNDAVDGTSQAAFAAQLTVLANQALTTGDVLLVIPPPTDPTGTPVATLVAQTAIVAAYYQVGAALGLNIIDLNARWVSYAVSNAVGFYYTDKVHPVQIGYQDIASTIANAILLN